MPQALSGTLRVSCLKLLEIGWRAKGVAPQAMQARVALKASSLKIQDHGFRTRHCASSSRSLGGSLKASFLKLRVICRCTHGIPLQALVDWVVLQGVVPQVLVAWAAHLWNRPTISKSLVCVLRVSRLKLREPGWRAQGIAPQVLRGLGRRIQEIIPQAP